MKSKGIFELPNGKWRAVLIKNKERVLDKCFQTFEEALSARNEKVKEYKAGNLYIEHTDHIEIIVYSKLGDRSILIDKEDREIVENNRWHIRSGYASAWINGKKQLMHRLLLGNPLREIDHKNGNRIDNRRNNLRECTGQENSLNKGMLSNNTSGCTGVTYYNDRKKWRAFITKGKKITHLGFYDNIEDAIVARKKAEKDIFGEFRRNY